MAEASPPDSETLISVIIPTFNRESLIGDAIDSVLNQDHRPLEIIVVDDGSTDRTAEIVRSYDDSVTYAVQANAGPAAARNHGLRRAKGPVVGFVDSDDVWTGNRLRRQLAFLQSNRSVDIVLGHTRLRQLDSKVEAEPRVLRLFHLGCGLFRRSVFASVGLFDPAMRYNEDEDWFMRARERGINMVFENEVTQDVRIHDGNMTRDPAAGLPDLLRLLKNHRDRQRRPGPL